MKQKNPKEEDTSSGTPKKKQEKKNRLADMIKAMEERSNPVKAHRVATDYFKTFREERQLPPSPSKTEIEKHEDKEEQPTAVNSAVTTAVITPVDNAVTTAVDTIERKKKPQEKQSTPKFEYLDATHTPSESKVYSIMYRECSRQNTNELRFGLKEIKEKTGLSDKTVRVAIHSLEEKLSIKVIEPSEGIYGRKFHVFTPKEILEARHKAQIEIDPTTKRIVSKGYSTVDNAVTTAVDTGGEFTAVSAVDPTAVSTVKTTALDQDTPYIYLNKENRDDEESSSSNIIGKSTNDDTTFDHKFHVVSLYKKYTGNKWKDDDDEFYKNMKDILPDIIEAAIIASVLRSKLPIYSFAQCEGAIKEFQEELPSGYVSYLREKWRESKGRALEEDNDKSELRLPKDSNFQEEWLKNYISSFPEEERPRIKNLAERFDHFILTGGKKKDWINNPTGTFISLVRNEINLKLPEQVPTFEERLEEQRQKEEQRLKEEQIKRERERTETEIRATVEELQGQDREAIIKRARELYDIYHGATDEDVIERIVYKLLFDHDEGKDWREGWGELKG